ncbi:MAG: chorismate lyase [Pseudomonadota bacterium]
MSVTETLNPALPAGQPACWQSEPSVGGSLADWLLSDRLMTPDMQRSLAHPIAINVLREEFVPAPVDVAALIEDCPSELWLREIVMRANGVLLVHALCFATAATLKKHLWLKTLGDRPLGGQLATLDGVARTHMSFCAAAQLHGDLASKAGPGAWARRSVFELQGSKLVLIEHMSADLTTSARLTDDH